MARPWDRQVDRFCRQYLQLEQALDYPDDEYLKLSEVQNAINTKLFTDGSIPLCKPPAKYKLRVLKELVERIEASIDDWNEHEVSEDLMSCVADLLSTSSPLETEVARQKSYVTYHLSSLHIDDAHITLLENRSLIAAGGTTGLRTWEAALHLGHFLCHNPMIATEKRILDLGTGTGYLSILCAKYLRSNHVIASDGSDDVVNNLADNFFLNQLQGSDSIAAMELKWGHALVGTEEEKWNGGRLIDVVLGADITYDEGLMPALVGTLLNLIELNPQIDILIAATQRNQQTFKVFLDRCQMSGLYVMDLPFETPPRKEQDGPFYDSQVAIRICKIVKPSR